MEHFCFFFKPSVLAEGPFLSLSKKKRPLPSLLPWSLESRCVWWFWLSLSSLHSLYISCPSILPQSSPYSRHNPLLSYMFLFSPQCFTPVVAGLPQLSPPSLGSISAHGSVHAWFCFPSPTSPHTNRSYSLPTETSVFFFLSSVTWPIACLFPMRPWSLASPCDWCLHTKEYPIAWPVTHQTDAWWATSVC